MHSFNIIIRSIHQVQEFVSLAMVQPFEVLVGNDNQQVNGKGFIGILGYYSYAVAFGEAADIPQLSVNALITLMV